MIVYNTLIAIAAGAAMIGMALLLRAFARKQAIDSEGWAMFFAVVGVVIAVLGFATTITWPYGLDNGFEYANIAFGEPAAALGALCLGAAIYLWRNRALFAGHSASEIKAMQTQVARALRPVSIFVFICGLMMSTLALTWVRFMNGTAPEIEPISGLFHNLPWVEAIVLFGLWAIVAVGCLLFPFILRSKAIMNIVIAAFMLGGLAFTGFGTMNFYTHIGMYTNISKGTNYRY